MNCCNCKTERRIEWATRESVFCYHCYWMFRQHMRSEHPFKLEGILLMEYEIEQIVEEIGDFLRAKPLPFPENLQ